MNLKNKLGPVQSTTLLDSVYKAIFQAIVSGTIRPGERIILEEMAELLDVSVMPVREAVKKLEAINLVTIRNRRILANSLSPKSTKEILEVRLVLECYAAAEAAQKRREGILTRLEECLEKMVTTHDPDEYIEANREFHYTIYKESGNTVLLQTISSLWERYSPYFRTVFDRVDWTEPRWTESHAGMLKALGLQDEENIRYYTAKDLSNAAAVIIEIIKDSSLEKTENHFEA